MTNAPRLRLVNTTTGELVDHEPCERCGRVENETLARDLELAEKDLRRMRKQLKKAQDDADERRANDPKRAQIEELFDHWRNLTGHPRSKLTVDRFDAIRAALKLYTFDQLMLAVEGIAAVPYVVNGQRVRQGSKANRHDDVTLACTQGKRIENFANLGFEERKRQSNGCAV